MWDEFTIEEEAVKRIKDYFNAHPEVRTLSARRCHTLKFNLKNKITRYHGAIDRPGNIPEESLRTHELVEQARMGRILA